MIGVVSYGAGNIGNVLRALAYLGRDAAPLSDPKDLLGSCSLLVLPGVGAFPPAATYLKSSGWGEALREWVKSGRPLLGICLGMQLLCEASLEDGRFEGLGLISGTVERLKGAPKLPHIGWNTVTWGQLPEGLQRLSLGRFYYFVHSYALPVGPDTIGTTETGNARFSAAVAKDNVVGFQFHPERSGRTGLSLLSVTIDALEALS